MEQRDVGDGRAWWERKASEAQAKKLFKKSRVNDDQQIIERWWNLNEDVAFSPLVIETAGSLTFSFHFERSVADIAESSTKKRENQWVQRSRSLETSCSTLSFLLQSPTPVTYQSHLTERCGSHRLLSTCPFWFQALASSWSILFDFWRIVWWRSSFLPPLLKRASLLLHHEEWPIPFEFYFCFSKREINRRRTLCNLLKEWRGDEWVQIRVGLKGVRKMNLYIVAINISTNLWLERYRW